MSRENGKGAPSETDAQLVQLVRDGDQRAFERLVRRHLREAHVVAASRLGGDSDDADDVVQEAFIRALEKIDDCRRPERFRAWLLTIVRNKAHNYRDYQSLRRGEELDEAVAAESDGEDPSRRVERLELKEDLDRALQHLTDLQREVFVRFDLEGWDHGEIADDLGISRNASRFHLHVARKALRKDLTAYPLAWSR